MAKCSVNNFRPSNKLQEKKVAFFSPPSGNHSLSPPKSWEQGLMGYGWHVWNRSRRGWEGSKNREGGGIRQDRQMSGYPEGAEQRLYKVTGCQGSQVGFLREPTHMTCRASLSPYLPVLPRWSTGVKVIGPPVKWPFPMDKVFKVASWSSPPMRGCVLARVNAHPVTLG